MAERNQENKISYKLIIILTTVVIAISVISTIYFSTENSRSQKTNLTNSILNLANMSKISYAASLWNLNQDDIESLNSALIANRHVIAVNIFESNHVFLTGMLKTENASSSSHIIRLHEAYVLPSGQTDIKVISDQIIYKGRNIGSFDIYYSERYIQKEINRRNIGLIVSFLIIAFAIVSTIYFVMEKSLVKPILELADISHTISAQRDYSSRVQKKNDDEIGVLYDSFNSMLETIESNEREVKKMQHFLSNIIESMPSTLITTDVDGTITQWNRAAEIMTGISAASIIGKNIWESLDMFHQYRNNVADVIKHGSPVHFYNQKIDGKEIKFMNVSLFPLIGNGVRGIVIRMDDVTELTKKEEQLRQSQKMESLGTLAGGIAHDFNNILSGIMGYTELYKEQVSDRPKVYNSMIEVLKAAKRAKDLVQQILTFSRQTSQEKKPTVVLSIVKEVATFIRASLPATIEIKMELNVTSNVIMADPIQIHQVLMNLCTNAGQAMKDTGGILVIGLKEIFISKEDLMNFTSLTSGRYIELSIRDTGYGINKDDLERIFEPYYTTKKTGDGTGLGLAVAHGIVKDHGGEIKVYSEVGKGSIFKVYLPLAEKQMDEMRYKEEEYVLPRGKERILFIDDEQMLVNLGKELLEELGYKVIAETNPDKAIEEFKKNKDAFDLVITDKTMPHVTGYDIAKELRAIRANIPIILCSGFQDKEELKKLFEFDINHFITKPISTNDMAEAVRNVLDKSK